MKTLIGIVLALAASAAAAAPTVSMTAPTNGALYLAPSTFAVKANASAPGVGINRVEFYANGTLIYTDTTSPYQFDWTNVAAGTYAITAKAVDNNGAETTSAPRNVTVAATNTPPTVSLTAPADNARYLNPTSVTLSASASGPELNDILSKVEFYLNGTLTGTVTAAPYNFNWTSPALGTYTLTAVATDSQGAQTTSSARTFIVSDQNQAPTVSIVTPLDNSRWHAPASFMFQANASSGEANDIVRVEFYVNSVLQGQDTTAPYSINISNLTAGTYTLMARAIDGQNAQVDSVTRTITVSDTNLAPTVSLSAPANGANFPTAPAGFTLTASASAVEVNGWIQRVEFYVNGSLVNTDTAGPWSFNVSGLANGTYTLTAKAVDQLNAETLSAPITVTVGPQPKLHFIHVDHLNTPRLVANDQQQAVWRWDQQEPFGVNVPDENPSGLGAFEFALRFPGQYFDKETNLSNNGFRDLDPSTGRYIQSDPIGLGGGLNTYGYVGGSPLDGVDEFGLKGVPPLPGIAVGSGLATTSAWVIASSVTVSATVGAAIGYYGIYKPFGQNIVDVACSDGDDCIKLIGEIYDTIGELKWRFEQLSSDPCNLFVLAYDTPNPSLPGKCGTTHFLGHIVQIESKQIKLIKLISQAKKKGCAIPPEAFHWATRGIPSKPRGWYPGYTGQK